MNNYFDNEPSKLINSHEIIDPKSGKVIGYEEKYDSGMIVNEVEGYFYDHNKSRCEVRSRRFSFEDENGLYEEDNNVVVWKKDGTFDILNTQIKFYKELNNAAVINGGSVYQVRISTEFSRKNKKYDTFINYGKNCSIKSVIFNGEECHETADKKKRQYKRWKRRFKRTIMSDTKGYFTETILSRKNKFKVSVSIRDLLKY